MSEDEVTNTPTTKNATTMTFSYTPTNASVTGTTSYIPYTTYPSSFGYSYVYTQLSEQQLSDLESRMSQVVRKEIAHTLSLLLSALSDDEEEEEGE